MSTRADELKRRVVPVLQGVGTTTSQAFEHGPLGRLRRVVAGIVRDFRDDDVLGLSAELSYRWLLAVFPLAIMIAAISGLAAQALSIQDPADQLIQAAGEALPAEAAATIRPQLQRIFQGQDGALLSLGLILTIYAASSGMRALIKGLNRAYDVEETRPMWRQILVALGFTLLLGVSVVISFVVLVTGQVAASQLAQAVGLEDATAWLFELAPFPLAIAALGIAAAFLYRAAPARRLQWRWVLPGVILFVPGWIAATIGFSFYVANFGSYSDTYGAIGGVIVLLIWFYITALILLMGGELNAVLEREFGSPPKEAAAEDAATLDGSDTEAADAT
jgi:membrane protein